MGFNELCGREVGLDWNYEIVPILDDNLWYYVLFGDIRIRRSLGEKAN